MSPEMASERPLAPLGRALRRVDCGELDLVLVERRLLVCRRSRCADLVQRCPRYQSERFLLHRARARGLAVESYRLGGDGDRRQRRIDRMLSVLVPGSSSLHRSW
jgi:hypothetical protein